jgi:uncharacterized membrane protein
MQNIFISTIRLGAILGLALFVFAGEVFAAPILAPASVTAIANTSATLTAKMANPSPKNTAVWFEWGDTPNPTTVIGQRDIFGEGYFQGYLSGLNPGTTYYFRAGAMEGGITVYSSVVAFTTRGGTVNTPNASTVPLNTVSLGGATPVANTTGVAAATVSKTEVPTATVKSNTSAIKTNSNTKTDTPPCVGAQGSTAIGNVAGTAAVGNSIGVLPGTLLGWVSLFVGILIVFLIAAMILDSVEERRKAREEAKRKKLERERETE